MRIEFQNTLDDYREANGIDAEPRRTQAVVRSLLTWAAIAVLLGIGWVANQLSGDADVGVPAQPFPYRRLAVVLTPSLVLFGFFLFFLQRQFRKAPEPWNPPTQSGQSGKPRPYRWLWFVAIFSAFFFMQFQFSGSVAPTVPVTKPALPERLPSYFDHVLPLLAWVFLVVVMICASRMQRTRGLRLQWGAMRHEHEPRALTSSEAGIVLEQPSARLEYRWAYFAGYRETPNLILLYTSSSGFLMVPKRAFVGDEQLVMFKGMVMTGIPRGHFLPTGDRAFQVLSKASPAQPNRAG